MVPTVVIIGFLGLLGGWVGFAPISDPAGIVNIALILFFLPALAEELIFRGILLSWLGGFSQRLGGWGASLLFVAWHPLQALTFGPPWSATFLQPTFLVATFVLAIVLTHIRIVSRSLWPVIIIHWGLVTAWKLLFAGPFF